MTFLAIVNSFAFRFALLAQEKGAKEAAPESVVPWWLPIALIGMLFYFLLFRPQNKERREHAQMLENLKKNDRVVTIGGIYGTVVEVKPDRVVLRVDDNSNTRIQMSRGSISRLVVDEKAADKESKDG